MPDLFARQPETPLPGLIGGNGLIEDLRAEVRPQDRREKEFRISALPEQEIAYPHFTASPDDQVRIGTATQR